MKAYLKDWLQRFYYYQIVRKALPAFIVQLFAWLILNILFFSKNYGVSLRVALFILKYFENSFFCKDAQKKLKLIILQLQNRQVGKDNSLNLFIQGLKDSSTGKEIESFYQDKTPKCRVRLITIEEKEKPDKIGDLIVLKRANLQHGEKGIVLIKFNEAITKFPLLYDLQKIAKHYRLILEPSHSGYHNEMFFLYFCPNLDVIVEAPHKKDYKFIETLGGGFFPSTIGAGDWCDSLFFANTGSSKKYDLVMLGSWHIVKRSNLLFQALAQIDEPLTAAVVGYHCGGRTVDNVKSEARKFGVEDSVEFFDFVSQEKVVEVINQSRLTLLLSWKEGANRAIYESMFCNVPILVYKDILGINRLAVNQSTGMFTSYNDLNESILYMLNNINRFHPRQWALKNTGYEIATRKINLLLQEIATANGEPWTQDIFPKKNAPSITYANANDYLEVKSEYRKLESFLRH